jgi:hypothetical protein
MPTFKIHSNADTAQFALPWCSRDYWVKHSLGVAMHAHGGKMTYGNANLDVWMWGWINKIVDPEATNVLWIIGHPQLFLNSIESFNSSREFWKTVFCSSKRFCTLLKREHGIDAEWLVLPAPGPEARDRADHEPFDEHDLGFIGNADPAKSRGDVAKALQANDSAVYGPGWRGIVDKEKIKGDFLKWDNLPAFWDAAKIVPYSTHKDMRRQGFIADSVLDTMVNSHALVIPDNCAWDDYGFENLKSWENNISLEQHVKTYLADPVLRKEAAVRHSLVAQQYTYEYVAMRLLAEASC